MDAGGIQMEAGELWRRRWKLSWGWWFNLYWAPTGPPEVLMVNRWRSWEPVNFPTNSQFQSHKLPIRANCGDPTIFLFYFIFSFDYLIVRTTHDTPRWGHSWRNRRRDRVEDKMFSINSTRISFSQSLAVSSRPWQIATCHWIRCWWCTQWMDTSGVQSLLQERGIYWPCS